MAIQVNGTDVISNSRGLNNIASIDSATTTTFSNAGVSPAATSALAVGAYATGRPQNNTQYNAGDTASGFYATATQAEDNSVWYDNTPNNPGGWNGANGTEQSASGTWRAMGDVFATNNPTYLSYRGFIGIWARIS